MTNSPSPQKSSGFPMWQKVLLGVAGFIGVSLVWQNISEKNNYAAGHAAYEKADCTTAIAKFDAVVKDKKSGGSDYVKKSRQEREECIVYKTAFDSQQAGKAGDALATYSDFASKYSGSPLMSSVQTQVGTLFSKDKAALVNPKSCEKLEQLSQQKIVPQPETNVPPLFLSCAKNYESAKNYAKAGQVYERFLTLYPKSTLLAEAKAGFARSLVAQAQATGAGALPDPQSSGSSGSDASVVRIKNSSPNRLRIAMTGPESRVEELAPCTDCVKFSQSSVPADCPEKGTVGEYTVKPGKYDVVVLSADQSRVTPFRGNWSLNSGEGYSNCFYIVTRR